MKGEWYVNFEFSDGSDRIGPFKTEREANAKGKIYAKKNNYDWDKSWTIDYSDDADRNFMDPAGGHGLKSHESKQGWDMKKKLDDMMLETLGEEIGDELSGAPESEEGEIDMENEEGAYDKIFTFVKGRIQKKPAQAQADLYETLVNDMVSLIDSMPQGERKLIMLLKEFRKENL